MPQEVLCLAKKKQEKKRYKNQYDEFLKENESLFTADIIKEKSNLVHKRDGKIKTLRRQGCRYPDDEYFFLKLIDTNVHTMLNSIRFVIKPKVTKI